MGVRTMDHKLKFILRHPIDSFILGTAALYVFWMSPIKTLVSEETK